jgi:hypothetical protein
MQRKLKALIVIIVIAVASPVWAKPKKFKTPEEMADFTQDFTTEEGTFKVLSRKPLHIEVRVTDVNPDQKYAAESMLRAFLWTVYRTFLHTEADNVKVTVVSPIAVDGRKSFTASTSRPHAQKIAQQLLGISDMSELLTDRQTWSEAMKRCYYSDYGTPGLRKCALAVAGHRDTFGSK